MPIQILNRYLLSGTIGAGNNLSNLTIPNSVNPDHTIVMVSAKTNSNAYSPQDYYVTAQLISSSTIAVKRGTTANFSISYNVEIVEFNDTVWVQRGEAVIPYGYYSKTITLSNTFNKNKSFPIIAARTTYSGQDSGEFVVSCHFENPAYEQIHDIYFEKYSNTKEIIIDYQIVEIDESEIETQKINLTDTIYQTSTTALNSGFTKENSLLFMNYKAISGFQSTGSLRVGHINASNEFETYCGANGSSVGRCNVWAFIVKFDNFDAQNEQLRLTNETQKQSGISKDMSKDFFINYCGNEYGYLGTQEENWDDGSINMTFELDSPMSSSGVYVTRQGNTKPARISLGYLEGGAVPVTDKFNHLHYIGRGMNVGVGVGIC